MLSGDLKSTLDKILTALSRELGPNLYSCCLYGSAVRGNFIEGVSDLNLLVVLNTSDSEAHEAIGRVLIDYPKVDPFILARTGFERSVTAFAAKFASIKRTYRVLHGVDPLVGLLIDPALERFLCEQAMRNLRLRLVYSYVTRHRHKSYVKFLSRTVTPLFLRLSEIVRLHDDTVAPADFVDRIPLLEKAFGIDGAILQDLLTLKKDDHLIEKDAEKWHVQVFPLVDSVLRWVELNWELVVKPH